jgi:hypothetical protein
VAPFVLAGTNDKNRSMIKLTTLILVALFFAPGAYGQQIKSVMVEKKRDHNVLRFIVPSESNVVDYRIEASSDNVHFEIVGKVKSTGNSVLTKAYQYDVLGGLLYYRVASVGMNGSVRYSETVACPLDPNYPESRAITHEEPLVVTGR